MTLREEVMQAYMANARAYEGTTTCCSSGMDAAIAIVLERAARVAEARVMGDRSLEDQEAERIAQAIRALSEEGE